MQMQMQATDDRGQPTHLYLSISMERRQGGRRQRLSVIHLTPCMYAYSHLRESPLEGQRPAKKRTHLENPIYYIDRRVQLPLTIVIRCTARTVRATTNNLRRDLFIILILIS
jgi:hypothetical protein